MTKIVLLKGLVCTGKSELKKELTKRNLNDLAFIDIDEIRHCLTLEKYSDKTGKLAYDATIKLADFFLNNNKNVIISDVFVNKKLYYKLKKHYPNATKIKLIETENILLSRLENRLKNRAIKNSKKEAKKLFEEMKALYEKSQEFDNFKELNIHNKSKEQVCNNFIKLIDK
jgi:shikimate kinase